MNVKAKRIKVAIADDHPIVLCGLEIALQNAGVEVVGIESSATGLVALLADSVCDVVVTDYAMLGEGELDGWCLLATISSEYPRLPVLVYSEFDDPFLVGSLAQRGIAGIVSKRDEMSQVLAGVRQLAAGGRYLSPIAHDALERFGETPALRRFAFLTRRQMEVAGLMLCGLSVSETARLLRRRPNTISMQRAEACRRLGFSGESEMYRFAAGHGLWLERSAVRHALPQV